MSKIMFIIFLICLFFEKFFCFSYSDYYIISADDDALNPQDRKKRRGVSISTKKFNQLHNFF